MQRKPLVYIAGPYRHPDPIENTHKAIRYGMAVWDSGVAVPLIPHLTLLAHMVVPRPEDTWLRLDDAQLLHCDGLIRLPGRSDGSDAEVALARANGIETFSLGWGEPEAGYVPTRWLSNLGRGDRRVDVPA